MKTNIPKFPFVNFLIAQEYLQRNGEWNPRWNTPPFKGGLQINVFGTRAHYLRLASFLRRFARRDTSRDSEYHEHFMGLMSACGNLRLHVILRKDDVGDSTLRAFYPKPLRKKCSKPATRLKLSPKAS